jgi:hypothetical protein
MAFSQLRPLGIGEILDGAFTIYRRHFASLFLTSLIPQVPLLVAVAVYAAMVGPGSAFGTAGAQPDMNAFIALAAMFPIGMVSVLVTMGAVTHQFARAYTGTPVTTGEALKKGFQRLLPMTGAYILVSLMAMLGAFACGIGMIVVLAACFAVAPAVMLERRGPVEAISRSWQLISGGWVEVLVVGFVVFLLQSLPGSAVSMGFAIPAAIMGAKSGLGLALYIVGQVLAGLARTLVIPFWLGTKVLLYYDRRVRTEALDVQMMTESLNALPGGPMGPGGPGMPGGPGYGPGYGPPPADQPMPRWG